MIVIGIIIGIVISLPFVIWRVKKNYKTKEENERLVKFNHELTNEQKLLICKNQSIEETYKDTRNKLEGVKESYKTIKEQAEKYNDDIYQSAYDLMQEHLSSAAEQEAAKYQKAEEEYKEHYATTLKEYAEAMGSTIAEYQASLTEIMAAVNSAEEKQKAFIEAKLREEAIALDKDKYKISLLPIEKKEIECLRSIIPMLRNSRCISKIIWETYCRDKANEMFVRVLGEGKDPCGIYKITCLNDSKVYIGQSAHCRTRWRDHLKCGCGIDAPSNKLYTAMQKEGIENFTFELLEECDRELLDEKERYWIGFYNSTIWGYNETKGNGGK